MKSSPDFKQALGMSLDSKTLKILSALYERDREVMGMKVMGMKLWYEKGVRKSQKCLAVATDYIRGGVHS